MEQLYTQTTTQNPKNIQDVNQAKKSVISYRESVSTTNPIATSPLIGRHGSGFSYLAQNKGKGPPGRQRSPVYYADHPPDSGNPKNIFEQQLKSLTFGQKANIHLNTEYQTKTNFISQLNFTIMKKQILFLAFFILAALASITNSYGQGLVPGPTRPTATTCVGEPLHPYAGKPYDYSVTIGNGVAVPADGYTWWATKDQNFITASGTINYGVATRLNVATGELIAVGPGYGTTSGTSTMNITWSPEILAGTNYQYSKATGTPTFVAVVGTSTCTNNVQVYEINPKPAFTVDITNIDPSTMTSTATLGDQVGQCVDIVRSAIYNTTSHEIDMDYGTNTLYFEVIAANFVTNWTPLFQIMAGSLAADQTVDIGWATSFANAQAGTFVETEMTGIVDGGTASGTTAIAADATVTDTNDGVSLYVRVVIHNNQEESLALRPFTLAVDGVDSTNEWDLVNLACTEPDAADQDDKAIHNINPRPQIDDATTPELIADPQDFIIKTNP